MKTSPRWQSGLLCLLAWLAFGVANVSIAQAATIATPVPTVTLTAPTDGATYIAPASITLSATAAESGGTIAKVEFYNDTTLLGTSTTSPYTLTLTNVAAGSYIYSATAYDSLGVSATSTSASVTVNPVSTAPTVTLTAPTDGATYIAPASITLSATASETGGTIAKVEFYSGTTLLGTSTSSPYTLTLTNVAAGSYTYRATAYDSLGVSATSTSASVTVNPVSTVPTVTLTAPTDGTTYIAPASITLSATAVESGGTIAKVEFYNGTILLAAATAAPYSYTWSNIPVGSYTFTAVATDIRNVSATSSPVSVTIGAAPATPIYYIYSDQLNTPRLITDTANTPVWRNDQGDPFNASAPYDDPGNTGHHFVFNLRFPGQYYDQETGLAYNLNRDYDAGLGRYVEADPIGLNGGMNPYSYVGGNPLLGADPLGLDLTITLYQGAVVFGHIGIGVNSSNTNGFYPVPGYSGLGVPAGQSVPGVEHPDTQSPSGSITLHTKPAQDKAVQDFINARVHNPGNYNLYGKNGNNCATTVEGALHAAGISTPQTRYPVDLFHYLQQHFGGNQ